MKRVPTPLRGRAACLTAKNKASLTRAAIYLFPNVGRRWAMVLLKRNFKLFGIKLPWKLWDRIATGEAMLIEKLQNSPTRNEIIRIHKAAVRQANLNCVRCGGNCRCDEEE